MVVDGVVDGVVVDGVVEVVDGVVVDGVVVVAEGKNMSS